MDIRVLTPQDVPLLCAVPDGLFDNPIQPKLAQAFLNGADNAMVAAFDMGRMVSFASGTILRHPDKAPMIFINEVGTRTSHRRQGYALAVSRGLMGWGRAQGITQFWLGTETDNTAARALYRALDGDEGTFVLYAWGFRWADE